MKHRTKIKHGEQVAIEYFQSNGYYNIVHEPDGQVPPDLLLNGSVAVEVRRLNQFKEVDGMAQPLEELEYRLMTPLRKMVKSYGMQCSEVTSFVSFDFRRPLIVNKSLMKVIKDILDGHLKNLNETITHNINDNFEIRLTPSTKKYNKPFVFASYSDDDGGAWLLKTSLTACVWL